MNRYLPSTAGELVLLNLPADLAEDFLVSLERGLFGPINGVKNTLQLGEDDQLDSVVVGLNLYEFNDCIVAWIATHAGVSTELRHRMKKLVQAAVDHADCLIEPASESTKRILWALSVEFPSM